LVFLRGSAATPFSAGVVTDAATSGNGSEISGVAIADSVVSSGESVRDPRNLTTPTAFRPTVLP
jgi:hypothetical protein